MYYYCVTILTGDNDESPDKYCASYTDVIACLKGAEIQPDDSVTVTRYKLAGRLTKKKLISILNGVGFADEVVDYTSRVEPIIQKIKERATMKVETTAEELTAYEPYVDVDCFAYYAGKAGGPTWRKRVSLDKDAKEISDAYDYFYSASDHEVFEEVAEEDVPKEVKEALDGRVEAAKDDILQPILEKL